MARVLKNEPIISQWLFKYGFNYDSNCYIVKCSGFERYYYNEDKTCKDWVTICPSTRSVFVSTEKLGDNPIVVSRRKVSIPEGIDFNNEDIFISWLDDVVG